MTPINQPSLSEELVNAITHGIGFALSVAGLVLMIVYSATNGTAWHIVTTTVFGASLTLLYLASTLYHGIQTPRVKRILQIIDHCLIYFLIAGTYTPFTLITIKGWVGWSLFSAVWVMAVCGVLFKIFFIHKFKIASTLAYIFMGWVIALAIKPLMQNLVPSGVYWLFAGGLCYTAGVIFYAWKKLPFNHGIWHLFVMAGSLCHFFAVFFYVIP